MNSLVRSGRRYLFAIFCLTIPICGIAHAQIGSSHDYEAAELKRHFQNQAEAYEIVAGGRKLKLNRQPLMQWNNPVRSQEQGSLYVWTDNGRPHVFASIFTYQYDGKVFCRHEMQSLSERPISAKLNGAEVWSPNKPGLNRKLIDDLPPPSNSAPRRLARMRAIARQFSGTLEIPNKQLSKLVLKPQPVLRYQSKESGIVDGAIFSLAIATDPEIWIVIEANKNKRGELVWTYAPIRSHYHELELKRNGVPVWKAPMTIALENTRAAHETYSHGPYFVFHASAAIPPPEKLR